MSSSRKTDTIRIDASPQANYEHPKLRNSEVQGTYRRRVDSRSAHGAVSEHAEMLSDELGRADTHGRIRHGLSDGPQVFDDLGCVHLRTLHECGLAFCDCLGHVSICQQPRPFGPRPGHCVARTYRGLRSI